MAVTEPAPSRRPWLGFASAVVVASAALVLVITGVIRRDDAAQPDTSFNGLTVRTASGDEVTFTDATLSCQASRVDTQGVLAVVTAEGRNEAGAVVTMSLTVGTATYAREQNLSLPHLRDQNDPRFSILLVQLPAQQFSSREGEAAGSMSIRASCASDPFVELIGEGKLGEVGGESSLTLTGSLRATL